MVQLLGALERSDENVGWWAKAWLVRRIWRSTEAQKEIQILDTTTQTNTGMSLHTALKALLDSLPPRPFDQEALSALVRKTLDETKNRSSPENRKGQWEYLLKDDIFKLAVTRLSSQVAHVH
jgi:hypothetical protein